MRKCLVLLLILLQASVAYAGVCTGITIDSLREHVPIPPAQIVSKRDVYGLCEVILKINNEYVPIYATSKFVIAGEMFVNRHQITQESLARIKAKFFLKFKKVADKLTAFTYRPKGKIRHTIYMFTDPVCPFCHRAEKDIKQIADQYKAQVKFIFFPVHIPIGEEKAVEAVCKGLTANKYLQGSWRKDSGWQCKKGKEFIKESESFAKKLGVRGVPTFFLDNGEMIVGANLSLLRQELSR